MGNKRFMAGVQEVLVDRYELLEVLGRGGMGVVFRARDRVLDRTVAIKVLPLDRAQDPTAVARFEREALAAARLSHRNIVAVFDFGADDETRFIVMEYLAGQSLAALVHERGPLPVTQAVMIAAQVADALAAAHNAGIVHRDIKPANVMVDPDGHVKVLDFGIARLTSGASLTQTATVIGSAPYLAPELLRGAAADARSDIYALGCVLYELLAGQPPFTGELTAAVLHQHDNSPPQPPSRLNPAVPAALDDLILRMLAKERGERPQQADAVLAELAAVDGHGSGAASTVPLPRRTRPPAVPMGVLDEPTRAMADTTRAMADTTRVMDEPTRVMADGSPARPAGPPGPRVRGRALGAAALLALGLLLVFVLGSAGGPKATAHKRQRRPAAKTSAKRSATNTAEANNSPTTSTRGASSSTAGASSSSTTVPSTSSPTVASTVSALGALVSRDVQTGAVSMPAATAIIHDAQALVTAAQAGQAGPVMNGLVRLGADLTHAVQHGQISASAVPQLNAAMGAVGAALQQSIGTTLTAPAGSGPGGPSGAGPDGGLPPGQAKKLGQNDQ